jgi:hypothetical protein
MRSADGCASAEHLKNKVEQSISLKIKDKWEKIK